MFSAFALTQTSKCAVFQAPKQYSWRECEKSEISPYNGSTVLAHSGVLGMMPPSGSDGRPSFPLNIMASMGGGGLMCAAGILTAIALLARFPIEKGAMIKSTMSSPRQLLSDVPFPPSPAHNNGYLPDTESDDDHLRAQLPQTPRKPRRRHSSIATTPRTSRVISEPSEDERDEGQPSPTVVRVQPHSVATPSLGAPIAPLPVQATPPIYPTGTPTPPSLGSAAASVLVGPMSVRDALAQIISLCGGQFYDDGRPKSEVEYRRNFISATIGLSDEQIASLWVNNLVYDGPAYDWYDDLIQSADGEAKAKKWSTLSLEIEKRWPTPPRDRKATKLRHKSRWREHSFNVQDMLSALADNSASVKPHQAWAQQHKALGAAIPSMADEDKVQQTLEALPVFVIELLPQQDRYTDEWETLIKDIGEISSRLLLSRYEQHSMVNSMYSLSLSHEPRTQPSPGRWDHRASNATPQSALSTPARRPSGPRFNLTPQFIPEQTQPAASAAPVPPTASAAPLPISSSRPHSQTPRTRDQAPHLSQSPQTPQTPGPVPSVLSRAGTVVEPPPAGAKRVPDTPADKAKWLADVKVWKEVNRGQKYSLGRPFPFQPGSFEQTANSCTRCGRADHFAFACEAEGADVLDYKEQGYRRVLARKLRDDLRAGTQPSTPTPGQRYRDVAQLEIGSTPAPGDLVDPNIANGGVMEDVVGSKYEMGSDRTVKFSFISGIDTRSESNCFFSYDEQVVVDVKSMEGEGREWPFKLRMKLSRSGTDGGRHLWGTVDGGAMLCVLDSTVWAQVEHSFDRLRRSKVVCRMANGACVQSAGTGTASISYRDASWPIRFEVIDSRGAFDLLLGKDWLRMARASQLFEMDALSLLTPTGEIVVANENPKIQQPNIDPVATSPSSPLPIDPVEEPAPTPEPTKPNRDPPASPMPAPKPVESGRAEEEEPAPGEFVPRRSNRLRKRAEESSTCWVADEALMEIANAGTLDVEEAGVSQDAEELWNVARVEQEEELLRGVMVVETERTIRNDPLTEILDRSDRNRARSAGPIDVFQNEPMYEQPREPREATPPVPDSERLSDPFKPERVAEILGKVRIGDKLSEDQKERVKGLVGEFADIFARNLSEVLPVDFTQMKLDIPEGTTFPKRVGQKKFTEPQRQALYSMLDELEEAKIIERVNQDQVAAVSPINMVPKPGGAERPSLKTLQRMANSECKKYGIPVEHPDVGFHEEEDKRQPTQPAKWRLVQNFAAVNKVTQIRPFPMGDLNAKQQAIAGHEFVSVMDLQAGFHAIPIAPESVPYTGFYVEGRGHYVYRRMPFGLTGAPTVFCEMIAEAFHDLLGKLLEVWMDDMATAADDFDTGMQNLRSIFERCRTHKISLSAAKTVLFMTEATFAGARVSKAGIKPDPAKVRAILEWPEPKSVLDTMGFLGLAGSQRPKIKNFGRIAQPLSDLTRDVRPAELTKGGHDYKKALRKAKVELNEPQKKAFVKLKVALTSDPVLRAPVYDGRPFVVTTDGSKFGFGAVLSQEWEEPGPDGRVHKVTYPIAYASKRTSRSEERYIPFLLEFAALKFACDEFDSLIFGQPIELETDCKALADLLGHEKLNSTHGRWRESIIARNIVAVRHLPGKDNKACDALSRMYESHPESEDGPGRQANVDPGWESRKDLLNDMYLLLPDAGVAELLKRFEDDEYFSDILLHLLFGDDPGNPSSPDAEKERKRRAHKAEGYFIDGGKLWLAAGKHGRNGHEVECIPISEGQELALSVHEAGGHFGRDMTVLTLQKRFHWPRLRQHATEAVTTCPRCKNFGPRLLSALLKPITRARPFDLLVGDYVALPEGHGGFKTVLVIVDVYSRYLFAFPSRKPGTGRFTVDALEKISNLLLTPKTFMADGGKHFDCDEVRTWAAGRGVQALKTPPYAPWANGLAEGYVKLLVGRLKTLCAPTVGEDPVDIDDPNTTPTAWPKHLTTAVAQLNDRLLPSLGYTPRELMTGQLSAERRAEVGMAIAKRAVTDADVNLALTYSLQQDGFANALEHAKKRKKAFDKRVRTIDYAPGDLVQKYDARLDETHSTLRKLAPRWSGPLRVVERLANSYRLEDMSGTPFSSAAHARLLRPFIPRPGSTLAEYSRSLEVARRADKTASRPHAYFSPESLPHTPRPEDRLPLDREDPTQPGRSHTDASDDDDEPS
ncbi:Retrovirus-related Pol polyprotein from transposon opus [Ceratobasidium sp. AG-Ba]|nr:Retrovirus-related Pol polyprotein from transposon opus [Ceratobasidium sp. AG-Ba]